jgi:hypothetical protein
MNAVGTDYKDYGGLWTVQFFFFLIVNIIFLNVIFGIIIDTFSNLREMQGHRDIDIANVCFVCGHTRFDFSKKNKDFEDHKKQEHDPWQYVAFLYHMSKKGDTELNGLETAAWGNYENRETDWLPIGNTLYLNDEDVVDKLTTIEDAVIEIKEWLGLFQEKYLDAKRGEGHGNFGPSQSPTPTPGTPAIQFPGSNRDWRVPKIAEEPEIGDLFEVIEKKRNNHPNGDNSHAVSIPEGLARPTYPAHDDDGDSVMQDESRKGSNRMCSYDAGDLHHDSNMGPSLRDPVIFFPK